jgi:hypothetical protein
MNQLEKVLLVPAAGQSTRYGLNRPKFLLQHPKGGTMLEHSITCLENLSPETVDRIVIVTLSEHFEGVDAKQISLRLENIAGVPVEFFFLETPTSSVVETISRYLHVQEQDIQLMIKDSDNQVKADLLEFSRRDFGMAFASLVDFPDVVAHNKSFLEMGPGDVIFNIVEKQIISERISVGLTKFGSSSDFLQASLSLGAVSSEIYISDLVRVLLSQGIDFYAIKATEYEDWGTLKNWLDYVERFQTLFIDIDGVVCENMSTITTEANWSDFKGIDENIEFLLDLQRWGKSEFVFVTARGESFRTQLLASLSQIGFQDFQLVTGLLHSKRILVNDFDRTDPFPSAIAINMKRNSPDLKFYLKRSGD